MVESILSQEPYRQRRASIISAGCFSHAIKLQIKRTETIEVASVMSLLACIESRPVVSAISSASRSGTSKFDIIYVHVGCIWMEWHNIRSTANATDLFLVPRLRSRQLLGVACSRKKLLAAREGLSIHPISIGTELLTTDSVMKAGTSLLSCTQSRGPLDSKIRLLETMVPSMIVIGLRGLRPPGSSPLRKASCMARDAHCVSTCLTDFSGPHGPKTSLSLHSLPPAQSVSHSVGRSIGTRFLTKLRCPPSNTHTGRHHTKENG